MLNQIKPPPLEPWPDNIPNPPHGAIGPSATGQNAAHAAAARDNTVRGPNAHGAVAREMPDYDVAPGGGVTSHARVSPGAPNHTREDRVGREHVVNDHGSGMMPARFVPHADLPPGVADTRGQTLPTPDRPLHGGALRTPAPHGARGEGSGGHDGAGGGTGKALKLGRQPLAGEPTKTEVIYSLPEERGSNFSIYFSIIVVAVVTILLLLFVVSMPR